MVVTVPTLTDNLSYLLFDESARVARSPAAVVDPGEAQPLIRELEKRHLDLHTILLTHHHWDHIGGVPDLLDRWPKAQVLCSQLDSRRIPGASRGLSDEERFSVWPHGPELEALLIPGHTQGQLAYHAKNLRLLWVGDTLFRLGCGRLLEGQPEQLYHSLRRLAGLPGHTRIFVGHEYTSRNAEFSVLADPANANMYRLIAQTVAAEVAEFGVSEPLLLETERATNLFMRAQSLDVFTQLRRQRDEFRASGT